MIQLTKGTNVLDINLSDFSGAGQDVVQNGSFNDIGSDLVQNGDFAQIGSELITNGDFSAAGADLISNGDFSATGSELAVALTSWTSYELGTSTVTYDGSIAELNIDALNSNVGIYQENIFSVGKSYKIVLSMKATASFDAEILEANNASTESTIGTASLTTSYQDFTYYFTATGTFDLFIHRLFSASGASQTISIQSVSVKELGEDWTLGTGWNIGDDRAVFTGTSDAAIYQADVTTVNNFYKVSVEVLANEGTAANTIFLGTNEINATHLDVGVHTFYAQALGNTILYIYGRANDELSITNVTVQEIGEGWNVGTGWSIEEDKASVDASVTTPLSQSPVSITNGKSYKISLEITDYQSGFLKPQFGGQIIGDFNSNGVKTFYATADATSFTTFYLYALGTSDFSVSNVTVKEVGQDWTVGTGWSIEEDKARSIQTTSSNYLEQTIGTLVNAKNYKITFDLDIISATTTTIGISNTGAFGQLGSSDRFYTTSGTKTIYGVYDNSKPNNIRFVGGISTEFTITNITIKELDTNDRWVTFADPDSKSVMKLGQVDLEIDSSGNNCGVYQTGLIKPNKLYIITINMKATAAIYVEIAASLGTAVSAVIGTELLTTSYKEYSFEYVTPFAVDHDLQIHRLFGSGANQTISIDYVSMNGVDESQWTNDPTWDPFATSLVFVPTLTDESTNNSKQFTLDTSISDGGWDGRSLHGQVIINEFPTEVPASGIINLKQPDFLEGFYQVEIRGYLGTFYRVLGKCMAHLERTSTEDGYNRFESYNDTVTYKAYEE